MTVFTGSCTNAEILMNGVDIAGRMMELDFGEIGHEEVEHKALGMVGVLKLPSRGVSPIEATAKYEFLDPALKRQVMLPNRAHKLQLHQYVDVSGPDGLDLDQSHQLVTHVKFRCMKTKAGTAKLGEMVEMEQTWSVTSLIQSVFGEEIPLIEYDVHSKIYRVNGVDVWPT